MAEVQRDDDNLIAMKSLTQPEDVQNMNGSEKAEEEVNVQCKYLILPRYEPNTVNIHG